MCRRVMRAQCQWWPAVRSGEAARPLSQQRSRKVECVLLHTHTHNLLQFHSHDMQRSEHNVFWGTQLQNKKKNCLRVPELYGSIILGDHKKTTSQWDGRQCVVGGPLCVWSPSPPDE
jgi:hypothetical protein